MEDFNVTPAAVRRPEWDAWVCPPTEKYGLMRLDNKWAQYSATPIFALRSDGPAAYNIQTYEWYSQNPVIVNSALRYAFQYTKVANRIDANLRFLDNGDSAVVSFPNLKSATRVYRNGTSTVLGQASSLADLLGGSTERYWFRDNTLHVKLVGAGGGYDPQFGNDRSAKSSTIAICQNANGADATGRTDRATLADFEMGADSRGSLQGELSLVSAALSADSPGAASGPFDATDHQVSWSLVSDGDGVDEAVEESGFSGGETSSGEQRKKLRMHHEGGHGKQREQAVDHGGLGHAVMMLAGEVGFEDHQIRHKHLRSRRLGFRHEAAGGFGEVDGLAGKQTHHHRGIERRADLRSAHSTGG
jgi:hypothetical protein